MTKRSTAPESVARSNKRKDMTPKPRRVATKKTEEKQDRLLALRNSAPSNDVASYNPDRPLTEKMREFVKQWAAGETILSAAVRAGYSDGGSMAYKLAKDPAILKLYNEEKRLYAESCQMTRQRVMEGLLDGVEMAKTMAEPANVIAGWKTIGQMCGYFAPVEKKVSINVTGDVTMKHLNRMSDEQLLKLVKGEVTDVAFTELEGEEDANN